ncbi:MAG: hypothetical protein ACRD1W_04605, partial [Vicinamibacterales bacterium]
RYIKTVLTIIAGALIYLCIVVTPLPALSAQVNTQRPGEPSGPTDVVIVGWRAPGDAALPVSIQHQVRVFATEPLPIRGSVTTERSSSGLADRVVVVGWEENASKEKPSRLHQINSMRSSTQTGLPVRTVQ